MSGTLAPTRFREGEACLADQGGPCHRLDTSWAALAVAYWYQLKHLPRGTSWLKREKTSTFPTKEVPVWRIPYELL